ncbi:hypothetical protein ACHQM5_010006 [Ranunculus cassubicifolius]
MESYFFNNTISLCAKFFWGDPLSINFANFISLSLPRSIHLGRKVLVMEIVSINYQGLIWCFIFLAFGLSLFTVYGIYVVLLHIVMYYFSFHLRDTILELE